MAATWLLSHGAQSLEATEMARAVNSDSRLTALSAWPTRRARCCASCGCASALPAQAAAVQGLRLLREDLARHHRGLFGKSQVATSAGDGSILVKVPRTRGHRQRNRTWWPSTSRTGTSWPHRREGPRRRCGGGRLGADPQLPAEPEAGRRAAAQPAGTSTAPAGPGRGRPAPDGAGPDPVANCPPGPRPGPSAARASRAARRGDPRTAGHQDAPGRGQRLRSSRRTSAGSGCGCANSTSTRRPTISRRAPDGRQLRRLPAAAVAVISDGIVDIPLYAVSTIVLAEASTCRRSGRPRRAPWCPPTTTR